MAVMESCSSNAVDIHFFVEVKEVSQEQEQHTMRSKDRVSRALR